MAPDQIAVLTIPVFLLAMALEALVSAARGRSVYGFRQTFNNVAVAFGSRAVLATTGLVPLLGYRWIQTHLGLWQGWDLRNPAHVVTAFLLVDLAFYWRHRLAHRVAALWAVHAVHHQSREYNLSVATRLGWFQDAIVIAWPVALCGVPYELAFAFWLFGNSYQVFQHTELVGHLGPLDRWFLTPSNHRVHHGCNAAYLDCNYGNFLLIWDRLFGTWVPETEPVRYGVLSGLRTYDASENNLEPLRLLWRKIAAAPTWATAAQVPLRAPGWVPGRGEVEPVMVDDPEPQRAVAVAPATRGWAVAALLAAGAAAAVVSWNAHAWSRLERVPWLLATIFALAVAGVWLDARPVAPVPQRTAWGRARARAAAAVLTLAGPDARGPLARLGAWLRPEVEP